MISDTSGTQSYIVRSYAVDRETSPPRRINQTWPFDRDLGVVAVRPRPVHRPPARPCDGDSVRRMSRFVDVA